MSARKAEKILITGGAGYLGSVMSRRLLEAGYQVTVLDNFLFGQNSLLDLCWHEGLEIIRGDCRDERLLAEAVPGHDVLIPLAALVGAPLCDQDRIAAQSTNLDAVRALCKLAAKSQRILFPTTNSGYGIGQKGIQCTEETPLRPISFYGRTKVEAESAVLQRGNSITFRLATAFGASPRMRMDLLVNDFVYRAFRDRAVVVFEGHFKRNYIHVQDIARVFRHGIEHFDRMKGRPYNVGLEDANLSKIELCEAIKRVLPRFVYMEAAIGEDPDKRDYIVSNQRILSAGFTPEWSIERGIRELVKAYTVLRANPYANA